MTDRHQGYNVVDVYYVPSEKMRVQIIRPWDWITEFRVLKEGRIRRDIVPLNLDPENSTSTNMDKNRPFCNHIHQWFAMSKLPKLFSLCYYCSSCPGSR